jgi:hypothetical protein
MNVHKNLIHNYPNLKTIQMSFKRWAVKQTAVWYSMLVIAYIWSTEYYSIMKRNKPMIHTTVWIYLNGIKLIF